MGVLIQAFHWDCPRVDGCEHAWWPFLQQRIPSLARVGFTSLWLPPVHKAANLSGQSMGYDPYDYYDLGDLDQKGSVKTWFGSRRELLDLLEHAHAHGLTVLADMVINHNNGADAMDVNPITGASRWTRFRPKSGRFPRDWESFHPSPYETWDDATFGDMPDLAHRHPFVYGQLLTLARWLVEEIGFDGFRYDFVKGYGSWMVTAIQEYRYVRGGTPFKPFGVAENWSSARTIDNWTAETNAWNDNPVNAFDFPLRDALKQLCDGYAFRMTDLPGWDSFVRLQPLRSVTFVDNHDTSDGGSGIVNDKLLAYAYILTHEGYPCVYWKDYYNWSLGMEGTPNGIAALVHAHEAYAGGGTEVRHADDDLYIMERLGDGEKPGLVLALNNRGDRWNGTWVTTRWRDTPFVPVAWWSATDRATPADQYAARDGRAEFWAPPRGYAVYAPRS